MYFPSVYKGENIKETLKEVWMACWQITIDFMPVWPCTLFCDLLRRWNSRFCNLYVNFLCKWRRAGSCQKPDPSISGLWSPAPLTRMPSFPRGREQKNWSQGGCPDTSAGELLSQGHLQLSLFFLEVLNQGMLTSNVLWHGYYNQAQGLCMKISTCNYKGLSANLQVPCFIFI